MNEVYNEEYYNNYGKDDTPYKGHQQIIEVLEGLADAICDKFEVSTHLDVGCAMGYLVNAMNVRGVESRGIDISEYAIENADPEVQGFLRVHDITKPIGMYRYDIVTCIEVLEHLEPHQTERVIQNICNVSNKYIFFSSEYNTKEKTHINVRPTGHFYGMFEQRGFKYVNFVYPPIFWGVMLERI